MTVQQDSGGSIQLSDSDLFEVAPELALPDEVTGKQSAANVAPPMDTANDPIEAPRDEITNVRARQREEREWVDLHAVVDDEGRLRLPEDTARKLQPGAIVEVRIAAWAVDPDKNA